MRARGGVLFFSDSRLVKYTSLAKTESESAFCCISFLRRSVWLNEGFWCWLLYNLVLVYQTVFNSVFYGGPLVPCFKCKFFLIIWCKFVSSQIKHFYFLCVLAFDFDDKYLSCSAARYKDAILQLQDTNCKIQRSYFAVLQDTKMLSCSAVRK